MNPPICGQMAQVASTGGSLLEATSVCTATYGIADSFAVVSYRVAFYSWRMALREAAEERSAEATTYNTTVRHGIRPLENGSLLPERLADWRGDKLPHPGATRYLRACLALRC